jgi:hypothetical protein
VEVRAVVATDVPELARLWREFGAYYAELDPERFKRPKPRRRALLAETAIDSPVAVPFWDQAEGYAPTSLRYRMRLRR